MNKIKLLVCLLIMSLLVSCGDGGNAENNTATPTNTENTVTTTPEVTGDADKEDTNKNENTSTPVPTETVEDGTVTDNNTVDTEIPAAPVPGVVSVEKKTAVAGDIEGTEEAVTYENHSGISGYKVVNVEFKKKDTDVSLKEGDVKTITFDRASAKLDCPGAKVEDVDGRTVVTIFQKGSYVLTGSCSNGQVVVDSDENENVHLYLNGLDLNCNGSAAIYEKSCDKLIITLVKGSVNNLTEAGSLNYENPEKEEPDAVIFAKDKTVINGNGEITVIAENGQGICSTDDLIVVSGNINVSSASHGLKGKDSLVINSGNININTKEDGLKSSSSKDGKGYIVVLGGDIRISSLQDGIQAEGDIQLTGGTLSIYTGGGRTADSKPEFSCKGIKAGKDIYVNGSSIQVNSSEITVKADKNIIIDNGNVVLSSGKKGMSAVEITVNGGSLMSDSSKEGIEGKKITFNDGFTAVYSKNDGISGVNAENPEDNSDIAVTVNGGTLYVNAVTDGIDSKGDIAVNGGTVMIDGPIVDGNSAIDYKGKATISAGNFVAVASDGNVVNFSTYSEQNIIEVYFGSVIKAGTVIKVKNGDKGIIEFTNAKNCECAIISCAEFKAGETYSVLADDKEVCSLKALKGISSNKYQYTIE